MEIDTGRSVQIGVWLLVVVLGSTIGAGAVAAAGVDAP